MAFKAASIIMAPDGDPAQHRATIKTGTLEQTTVLAPLMDFDTVARVARDRPAPINGEAGREGPVRAKDGEAGARVYRKGGQVE
jgi:hypothetical protein